MSIRPSFLSFVCGIAALAASALSLAGSAPGGSVPFPVPETLRPAVAFWTRVYVEIGTDEGFLHDARHLGVVYETVRAERQNGALARTRTVRARKAHWREALDRLSRGGAAVNEAERRVMESLAAALGRTPSVSDLAAAASRLRFQLGQRNKFRAGLVRAGAHEDAIRALLRNKGLPEDLAYLPHVESSFNNDARSKTGAAGMWQFMPRTGRSFMTVDYVLDERLDPVEASHAAARLLRQNYASLDSWPLALTAYNHGAGGMRRAVRALGTSDIGEIVEHYDGRTFGFASRNFYAQFLAARAVASDAESHFGELRRDVPARREVVEMPFYVDVEHVERYLEVDRATLRRLNPALRPSVYDAEKRIPKGYALKLPATTIAGDTEAPLARIPVEHRHAEQRRSAVHTVSRGETLSGIAHRHKTSVARIVAMNGLTSQHRIWPGQRLELLALGDQRVEHPVAATPAPSTVVAEAPVPEAATAPVPQAVTAPVPTTASAAAPPPRTDGAAGVLAARDTRWRNVEDGEILVDSGETIGHLAEWLEVPSASLWRANGLSSKRSIRVGQRLQVEFSKVTEEEFVRQRVAYHERVEADFLRRYRINGVRHHALRNGENLWVLANRVYDVPHWLVLRYNPQTFERRLTPGMRITIPVLEVLSES